MDEAKYTKLSWVVGVAREQDVGVHRLVEAEDGDEAGVARRAARLARAQACGLLALPQLPVHLEAHPIHHEFRVPMQSVAQHVLPHLMVLARRLGMRHE